MYGQSNTDSAQAKRRLLNQLRLKKIFQSSTQSTSQPNVISPKKKSITMVQEKKMKKISNQTGNAIVNRKTYHTAEEKWRFLSKIDNSSIKNDSQLKLDRPQLAGTCLDMCPEKERYMREYQQIFSEYECNENKNFEPSKAVKDYERCSADKQEPPPSELRPTDVLYRTMNYLLVHIVNIDIKNVNMNWKNWYQFLWTRTRSIRKDITQQCLVNNKVVEIFEIITRFHIFCAARLVEEPQDVFDFKLNDENLKNCLQSLKDLYREMPANSCPNEAEFRAYMILMKIEELEMFEISEEVFKSKEVKFAFKISEAYMTNNYVRFFKLVQEADFILSCLLHRYFVSVRIRAFDVICRVYIAKKNVEITIPLDKFSRLLGFDNVSECQVFCKQIGLDIIIEIQQNIIRISNFMSCVKFEDASQQTLKFRAHTLVEDKSTNYKLPDLLVGPFRGLDYSIDAYLQDCIMNSFNSQGNYIGTKQMPSVSETRVKVEAFRRTAKKEDMDISDTELLDSDVSSPIASASTKMEDYVDLVDSDDDDDDDSGDLTGSYVDLDKVDEGPPSKSSRTMFSDKRASSSSLFGGTTTTTTTTTSTSLSNLFGTSSHKSIFNTNYNSSTSNLFSQPIKKEEEFVSEFKSSPKVKFVIPPKIEIKEIKPVLSDENKSKLCEEIYEEIVSEIYPELILLDMYDLSKRHSKNKQLVAEEIEKKLVDEVLVQTICQCKREILGEFKTRLCQELYEDAMNDVILEFYMDLDAKLIRKKNEKERLDFHLKQKYFIQWYKFKLESQRKRKSWHYMAGGPRLLVNEDGYDEYVNLIRPNLTAIHHDNEKHGVIRRLDNLVNDGAVCSQVVVAVPIADSKIAQTTESHSDWLEVDLVDFITNLIGSCFLRIINKFCSRYEQNNFYHLHPDILLNYYNDLIDKCGSFLTQNNANLTDINLGELKLPLLTNLISIGQHQNWKILLDNICNQLELSLSQTNEIAGLMSIEMTNDIDLFPWFRIVYIAIKNILDELPETLGHHCVTINSTREIDFPILNFEEQLKNHFQEQETTKRSKLIEEKTTSYDVQARHTVSDHNQSIEDKLKQLKVTPSRSSLFQDLLNRADLLQKEIEETKKIVKF